MKKQNSSRKGVLSQLHGEYRRRPDQKWMDGLIDDSFIHSFMCKTSLKAVQ
jgi:hypothetical protein